MKEYQIKCSDGVYTNPITYRKLFDESDSVTIKDESGTIKEIKVGSLSDVYKILREVIGYKIPLDFEEYTTCVEETIIRYFGFYSDNKRSLTYYLLNNDPKTFADLEKKNLSLSVVRSMVAHNLLIECSIDTVFKLSYATIDGREAIHAYNLVSYGDKHYIFDATIPTIRDVRFSPIICEIDDEIYNALLNNEEGYDVVHLNPIRNRQYSITYGEIKKNKQLNKR